MFHRNADSGWGDFFDWEVFVGEGWHNQCQQAHCDQANNGLFQKILLRKHKLILMEMIDMNRQPNPTSGSI